MPATDFQNFQRCFARHLRDPQGSPRPPGVPARRMAVYQDLLFNNLSSFLDSCFPVCRTTLGTARWQRLKRSFFRDWPCHTPWFREIPREFVDYLQQTTPPQALPAWLADMAHYEWIELAVDTFDDAKPTHNPQGKLLIERPAVNPTLHLLAYAWPVHRIGPGYRPRKPQASYLMVFRDAQDEVQFVESNPVTHRLLELLISQPLNGRAACLLLAGELNYPAPEALVSHGKTLLEQFRQQGIILGTLL